MELLRLAIAKTLVSLTIRAPRGMRFRLAKLLYDYNSPRNAGVELIVPYLQNLGLQLKFQVKTKDYISWWVFFMGEYDPASNALLRQVVHPGDIVIEAGANNGTETLLLGEQVGENGQVFAFEPVPHIASWLELNLLHNNLHNRVIIERLALGECAKVATFHLTSKSFSNQGMSSKVPFSGATEQLQVNQVTLDDWADLNNIRRLDLLKMDIQGAEIDLLRGGMNTIRTYRPIIFTEASKSRLPVEELWELLQVLGYNVFHVHNKNHLEPLEVSSHLPSGNWLAMHSLESGEKRIRIEERL